MADAFKQRSELTRRTFWRSDKGGDAGDTQEERAAASVRDRQNGNQPRSVIDLVARSPSRVVLASFNHFRTLSYSLEIPHSIHLRTTNLGPQLQTDKILRNFIVALSNKCPGCCKLIDGNQSACPRIESKTTKATAVGGPLSFIGRGNGESGPINSFCQSEADQCRGVAGNRDRSGSCRRAASNPGHTGLPTGDRRPKRRVR